MFSVENASRIIEAARPILKRGDWGNGTDAVCMMSAMVRGARSDEDCVTAGWPEWLSTVNHVLFDDDVGADDEDDAAYQFAFDVAKALETPRDTDKARDLFLIARLDTGDISALKTLRSLDGDFAQQISAVETVVSLLRRRINGEDVADEMAPARAAAGAAADAAADAARAAADAAYAARAAADAAYAARAAAYAAGAAAYAAYAAYAADAADAAYAAARAAADAADAAYAAARAAAGAAYAAARADLIAALLAS